MDPLSIDDVMNSLGAKSPIIAFCKPEIQVLEADLCQVLIPLIHETKNYLGTMGFGPLSIGADFSGGLLALYHMQKYEGAFNIAFSEAHIRFLRKPTDHVIFRCKDGRLIEKTLKQAYQTKQNASVEIHVTASMKRQQFEKKVADYRLALYIQLN